LCDPVIVMAEGSVLLREVLRKQKKMRKLSKAILEEDQN